MADERRALVVEAEENLTDAYRMLGDAADCLRGLGYSSAVVAIGQSKDAINDAKNLIVDRAHELRDRDRRPS